MPNLIDCIVFLYYIRIISPQTYWFWIYDLLSRAFWW